MADSPPLHLNWCHDLSLAADIAQFFVDNVEKNYISHAELQDGRAHSLEQWADNLYEIIHQQIVQTLLTSQRLNPAAPGEAIALLTLEKKILGLGMISFCKNQTTSYAVINDMVIDQHTRGLGLGKKLLDWLIEQCQLKNFSQIFLESGMANQRAHTFFKHQGFKQTSIVMTYKI